MSVASLAQNNNYGGMDDHHDEPNLTDEEYARRLQEEEFAHLPEGIGMPLIDRLRSNQNQENRQVQRNVGAELNSVRETSFRFLLFYAAWTVCELVSTAVILSQNWEIGCDKPLNWWLLCFSSRLFILFPLQIRLYHLRRSGRSFLFETKVRAWLDLIIIIWFIVGQTFVFGTSNCSRQVPALYQYSLVLIILIYVSIAFPYLLLIALCVCFPCVFLFLRLVSEPEGASEDAIRRLPSRKFQPPPTLSQLPSDSNESKQGQSPKSAEDIPSCAVCMENYVNNDELRCLPCRHEFHTKCVDEWLKLRSTCPLCRKKCTDAPVPGPSMV